MLIGTEPGPWGPTTGGGRRFRILKRLVAAFAVLSLVAVAAVATTGFMLYQRTEANLTRVQLDGLEVPVAASDARHFLIVGSDDRAGLSRAQQRELTLGTEEMFGGQRSDTVIYVAVSRDRSQVDLLSLPRDLVVRTERGGNAKLTDTFNDGPNAVIDALGRTYGLPVNHYAEISIGGFIDVVETLGGVTIRLDQPLRDRRSGADFPAGTIEMDATEALSFVRSRVGSQGDYERIARQQTFLRAVLRELVDAGNLTNPARLFRLVDDISSNVTTDAALGIEQLRYLVDELRSVVAAGVPMTTFPSYSQRITLPNGNPSDVVIAYEPGALAIREALERGEPLPPRATRDEAQEVVVATWHGGRGSATENVVIPTLAFAGYTKTGGAGMGPSELQAGSTTVVYALPNKAEQAEQVAALLGAEVRPMPASGRSAVPELADVVVAVGDDAVA